MKILKINNLINNIGQINYKGLDINLFLPGSQQYKMDSSECILATNQETIPDNIDITVIIENEYVAIKQQYDAEKQQVQQSTKQRLADIEIALANIMGV